MTNLISKIKNIGKTRGIVLSNECKSLSNLVKNYLEGYEKYLDTNYNDIYESDYNNNIKIEEMVISNDDIDNFEEIEILEEEIETLLEEYNLYYMEKGFSKEEKTLIFIYMFKLLKSEYETKNKIMGYSIKNKVLKELKDNHIGGKSYSEMKKELEKMKLNKIEDITLENILELEIITDIDILYIFTNIVNNTLLELLLKGKEDLITHLEKENI